MKKIVTLSLSLVSGIGLLVALWHSVLADPILGINNGLAVDEGSLGNIISEHVLSTTDTVAVVYTLVASPTYGTLNLNGTPLNDNDTFTQANINSHLLTYDHNGDDSSITDVFTFTIQDSPTYINQPFNITITPTNDAPIANPDTILVLEGGTASKTDSGGNLTTNDVDPDSTFTATTTPITAPVHFSGTFTIGSDGSFSYEHDGSENLNDAFSYEICDDAAVPLCDVVTATIVVTGVADIAPAMTTTAPFTIPESTMNGGIVGTVTVTDTEVTVGLYDTLDFSITNGNTNNAFQINKLGDNTTGQIVVNDEDEIDFETTTRYTLTVQVEDSGGLTDSLKVEVNITDVTPEPPAVPDGQEFFVIENSITFTSSIQVIATDPENNIASYTITAGNTDDIFLIDENTGELSVDPSKQHDLDHETLNPVTLTINAKDETDLSNAGNITIFVTDVNEPPIFNDFTTNIDENRPNGFSVPPFPYDSMILQDPENDTLTFGITPTTPFTINANTGQITVVDTNQLNFEVTEFFTVTAQATEVDGTDLFSDTAVITITLNNINEAPVIAPTQIFTVAENSPITTFVGTVAASDEDTADSGNLQFEITGGNASGTFIINPTNGIISVANNSLLDFETIQTFVLEITVTDSNWDTEGAKQDVENITVKVSNVNEPPIFNDFQSNIDENLPNGSNLSPFPYTSLILKDPENDTLTFDITPATPFTINATTGQISVVDTDQLNFEVTEFFTATVRATEVAGSDLFSDTAVITITLNNINEAPQITPNQSFTVPENSPNTTTVGTLAATDEDTADSGNLQFAITGGTGAGTFSIDNNGLIKVSNNSALNHEQNASLTLQITVTDSNWDSQGAKSDTQTITINVGDVNEQPSVAAGQSFTIVGFSPNGTEVGTVSATDPDDGDSLKYTIESGNTLGAFELDINTGKITVKNRDALDFDLRPTFNLVVKATDSKNSASPNQTIVINLTKPPISIVYLPAVFNNYRTDEPNDSCAQSYGISTNLTFAFLPEDKEDWYKFTLTNGKNVNIVLSNYQVINGQIIAYRGSCGNLQFMQNNGNFSSTKTLNLGNLAAGTYYIRIVTDAPSDSALYNLIVNAQ